MKRKATVFSIITILAFLIVAWLIQNHISQLQNQIDELQTQNRELQEQVALRSVKITEFTAYEYLGGDWMFCRFNATVQNLGNINVSDIRLEVTASDSKGTMVKSQTEHFGTIDAGEEKKIGGLFSIYVFLSPQHFQLQAVLKWKGTVLDEQTLS